ncbi:DUF5110 domain-containing protein, partial [bacterium]|nr:DUF5110 domain-containing protein [bacterium]
PVIRHTGEWDLSTLELVVSLDAAGRAEGLLYEDAGDGYGHRDGEYRLTRFVATRVAGSDEVTLTATIEAGNWPAPARTLKVTVLSED